jgi:hypothetical protein
MQGRTSSAVNTFLRSIALPLWLVTVAALPAPLAAQAAPSAADSDEDETDDDPPTRPGQLPAEPSTGTAKPAGPESPPTPTALVPPPPVAPSPFVFTLKGTAAASVFVQSRPFASGNGGSALYGPSPLDKDAWLLGGEARQSRLTFIVRGPPVLAGAIPSGTVELEMFGGQQVTSVPGATTLLTARDMMGNPIGTGSVQTVTSSPQGDESVLPRLRTAYVELNWDGGNDVLRVGQFHNLLLAMISASGLHPGTLGYGAGQLGWRSPGITYLHKFKLSEDMNLDAGLQLNRNSWLDNVPSCAAGMAPPTMNCVPGGVSLGEASLLPQVQARLILSSGKAESPWMYYAPNIWQIHLVGHWDRKDLSGVGGDAVAPARDSMDTMIVEAGFKLKLGQVLIASNGWYGKNSGNVYGNMLQQQTPDQNDISGFGVWGQVGFSFTRQFSLWAFAGIDRPDEQQVRDAGLTRLQNVQLAGMFAFTEGTFAITLELFYVKTKSLVAAATPAAPMTAPAPLAIISPSAIQPSLTVMYSF